MGTTSRNVAEALIDALLAHGVEYVFANIGTDYPALVEAFARRDSLSQPAPRVILAQHEMVALSAAQGAAQASGRPQVVFAHVDVGTQNLGGAVHNVARARVPILVFAGLSPWTVDGGQRGSRDHWIQTYQDAPDQASVVRQYMKWCYELRTAATLEACVARAFSIAASLPAGPVYLTAAREVLEQTAPSPGQVRVAPADLGVPAQATLEHIADLLLSSERPLVVTSDVGRQPSAVSELVALAERLHLPVAQSYASRMNFPTTHPLHLGHESEPHVGDADVLMVIEAEVPWLQAIARPAAIATVVHLDTDPNKAGIGFWDYPIDLAVRCDPSATLSALNRLLETRQVAGPRSESRAAAARNRIERARRSRPETKLTPSRAITPGWLSHRLGDALDSDSLLMEEAVSNRLAVQAEIPRSLPGTYFGSGGAALGYGLGAALGAKLAAPEKEVVLVVGDGSYVFGCPTAAFWAARRYGAPFLTVIYNNQGWGAVKAVTRLQYPEGHALATDRYLAGFAPASDLAAVAAASGAHAERVTGPGQFEAALQRARAALRRGQAAVLDVLLEPVERPD